MPVKVKETITISVSKYHSLLSDSEWLGYLEAEGVDNWVGFEYAQEARNKDKQEEKAL